MKKLAARALTAVLTVSLMGTSAAIAQDPDDPYGIKSWPDEPEWRSLTNHLQACYAAVSSRYEVVGQSSSWWIKPTFITPYQDYLALGSKIDEICSSFVVHTNADATGSFNQWLEEHPLEYENLPRWSANALHAYCGFTNWGNDSLLTSWAVCDRSIQTQVVYAIRALRITSASTKAAIGARSRWGDGWGWAEVDENATEEYRTIAGGTPSLAASSESGPHVTFVPGSVEVFVPPYDWYHNYRSDTIALPIRVGTRAGSKPWVYRVYATMSGTRVARDWHAGQVSFRLIGAPDPPWDSHEDDWESEGYVQIALPGAPFGSAEVTYTSHPEQESTDPYWHVTATPTGTATPFAEAYRYTCGLAIENEVATNWPSRRSLYARGALPQRHGPDPDGAAWMPEVGPLYTNKFACLYTTVSMQSNTYYTAFLDLEGPPCGYDENAGWSVAGLFWVLDWQFADIPLPDAVRTAIPPDTDLDGILNIPRGLAGEAEPYGTACFLPDWPEPFIRIPVGAAPPVADALTVHAEFSSGRDEGLPFRWCISAWSGEHASWSLRTPFNLGTRIIQEATVTEGTRREKRVSIMRPQGRLVVFDFAWTNGTFSSRGYPIGRDQHRSYVLEKPNDGSLTLRFADGTYHTFDGPMVTIGREDGTDVQPRLYGGDTGYDYRLRELQITCPWGASYSGQLPVTVRNLVRRSMGTWTPYWFCELSYDGAYLTGIATTNRTGTAQVCALLAHDELGRVSGITKSGHGYDAASVTISSDRKIIYHSWGEERLEHWDATPSALLSRVQYSSPSGVWSAEHEYDAKERLIRTTTTSPVAASLEERWEYNDETGRYFNGVPREAMVKRHIAPLGEQGWTYAEETGWPASATFKWRGTTAEKTWTYEAAAGEAANATNRLQMPRVTDCIVEGARTGRRFAAKYPRVWDGYYETVTKLAVSPDDTWETAGCVTTNRVNAQTHLYPYDWGFGLVTSSQSASAGWQVYGTLQGITTQLRSGTTAIERFSDAGGPAELTVTGWENHHEQVIASDELGRPVAVSFLDGTVQSNSNWCLHGPQQIRRRDGTTVRVEYDGFGRIKRLEEPDVGKVTTITADPLGVETVWSVTQGGVTRTWRLEKDLLGRPCRLETPLATRSWSYTPTDDGWNAEITSTGLGSVTAEYYSDGTIKAVHGPGAAHCYRSTWGIYEQALCNTITVLDPDGSPTPEWTRIHYNALDQAVKIQHAGVAGEIAIQYDEAGRPWRITDENGMVTILNHDERIGIAKAGLKRGGDDTVLEPAGNDRMLAFNRTLDAQAVTWTATAFPDTGAATAHPLWSEVLSHDGRHGTWSLGGKAFTADVSTFTGPGAFSADVSGPAGSLHLLQGPLGLLGMTSRDASGNLLSSATVVPAPNGLGIDVTSTEGTAHAAFDAAGRLTDLLTQDGETRIRYQPGTCLPTAVTDGEACSTVEYHANGLPRVVQSTGAGRAELQWDGMARLKTMTRWQNGQPVVTAWIRHPETGRLLRKEVNGQTVESYAWHANGQREQINRPDGRQVAFTYGPGGDPSGSTDSAPGLAAEAIVTSLNRMGHLASAAVVGGVGETYVRGLEGEELQTTVAGNGVVPGHSLTYDRNPQDGSIGAVTLLGSSPQTTRIREDSAGRVTNLTSGVVSADYCWDLFRNSSTAISVSGRPALILSNDWNRGLGVRTGLSWISPGHSAPLARFVYGRGWGTNRIATVTREDGSRQVVGYDGEGRLLSWTHHRPDGTADPYRSYAYQYDGAGNPTRAGPVDGTGEGRAAFEANAFNFHVVRRWNAIDVVGRVRPDAAVYVNGQAQPRDGDRFVVTIPLRASSAASVTNLTISAVVSSDQADWYATASLPLRLPACPETVQVSLAGAPVSDSLAEYLFDARNQLRRVTDKLGVPRLQTTYDYYADGRRARKVVSAWTNGTWQVAATHQFLYDRWNLVREIHTTGGVITTRDYTWGLDLAGLQSGRWDQESGGIGGLLAVTEVSGTATNIFLPLCDHIGTIHGLMAAVTNNLTLPAPILAETRTYSPYGELIEVNFTLQPSAFSLQPCPFGFQSKYHDAETGFWYYGYRFFDSRSGKWLTSDPIQEAGGLNLTEFCGGDPVNKVDALGLFDDRTMFAYFALTHPDAFSAYQDLHSSGRMDYLGQRDTWRNVTWDRSRSYYSTRSTRFWLDEDLTAEAAATLFAREVRAHPAYDATGFAAAEGDAERQLALHGANLGMGMQQAGMLAGMYVDGIASLVPGNDAVEAIRGKSATGQDLAGWQRALAAVPAASLLACLRRAETLDEAISIAAGAHRITGPVPATTALPTGAGTRGIAVIGPRATYRQYAVSIGARYLDVTDQAWTWEKNRRFLHGIVQRGDDVIFAGEFSPARLDVHSVLAREIRYLTERGYQWTDDFRRLVKKRNSAGMEACQ